MASRLATALLALPRSQGQVSDLLWRHSDPLCITKAGAIPSDEIVKELATFTGNEAATAVGKNLPTPVACLIAAIHGSSQIHEGIVSNPSAGRESLEKIASARSSASQAAQARIDLVNDAVIAAKTGESINEFVAEPDVAIARALIDEGFVEYWCKAVFASNNTAKHFSVYSRADNSIAERIAIGVIEEKMSINYEFASWLVSDKGLVADTLRAEVEADDRLRRRCSESAERTFIRAGLMVKERTNQPAGAISVDMIRTLRMMGSPASECAALVINNASAEIPSELLTELLIECSNGMVSSFLSGTSNRHPRAGEVSLLLSQFDHERISAVAEMIVDAVERVEWASELLLAFPRGKLDGLSTVAVADLDTAITAQLAEESARWEFLLTLSEEWEQSLSSLISAALAMDINE